MQLVRMPVIVRPDERGGMRRLHPLQDGQLHRLRNRQVHPPAGDELQQVILPGELERLSGSDLVKRLQASLPCK